MSSETIFLDGENLSASDVVAIARRDAPVALSLACRARLSATRDFIEGNWLTDGAPLMYAFNTGVGLLKSQRISPDQMAAFQTNLIKSHTAGTGEHMPAEVVRAMMALRLNAFASNHSGIRVAIVDRLLDMLNNGIIPIIPAKGSVGASGDLAPLALMSGALMGMPESRDVRWVRAR